MTETPATTQKQAHPTDGNDLNDLNDAAFWAAIRRNVEDAKRESANLKRAKARRKR